MYLKTNKRLKKKIAELEAQLETQEEQLKIFGDIISEMPGHIYWKDANSIYLGCNKYAAKMAGLNEPKEIVGKSDYELAWKAQADELVKNDKGVMEQDISLVKEEVAHLSDDRVATYVSHKKALKDKDGKVIGCLGISIDISEIKKLEKHVAIAKGLAEKANRSKIQLLNAINHIVRTQLTGVLGGSQLIELEEKPSPKLSERLSGIYDSGDSILPMLQTIYYYLDLELGRLKITEQNLNLQNLIDQVIEQHVTNAVNKNMTIRLIYDEDIPPEIVGDGILIKEILNTLVYNAVRFTQQGHITIQASKVKQEEDQVWVELAVRDTGIGIATEKQTHLFDLLELDVNEPESAFAHVGIKLSLANMIAHLLKGKLSLRSTLGKGSCFTLLLPFGESPDAKPALVLSLGLHLAKERYQFSEERQKVFDEAKFIPKEKAPSIDILIIEDHLLNLRVEKELLEAIANCKITTAMTVSEAKKKLDRRYDLILLDINLPDGNGIEIAREAKKQGLNEETSIVAATAHATEEEVDFLTGEGIDCVISKPITQTKLEDVLTYFVYHSIK